MSSVFVVEPIRQFRFFLNVNGSYFGISMARWEGPHLVLTRVMDKTPLRATLIEVVQPGEIPADVLMEVYDKTGERFRAWKIKYERVSNRGFDLLNANEDGYALEAVCLVNAHAEEFSNE